MVDFALASEFDMK